MMNELLHAGFVTDDCVLCDSAIEAHYQAMMQHLMESDDSGVEFSPPSSPIIYHQLLPPVFPIEAEEPVAAEPVPAFILLDADPIIIQPDVVEDEIDQPQLDEVAAPMAAAAVVPAPPPINLIDEYSCIICLEYIHRRGHMDGCSHDDICYGCIQTVQLNSHRPRCPLCWAFFNHIF